MCCNAKCNGCLCRLFDQVSVMEFRAWCFVVLSSGLARARLRQGAIFGSSKCKVVITYQLCLLKWLNNDYLTSRKWGWARLLIHYRFCWVWVWHISHRAPNYDPTVKWAFQRCCISENICTDFIGRSENESCVDLMVCCSVCWVWVGHVSHKAPYYDPRVEWALHSCVIRSNICIMVTLTFG